MALASDPEKDALRSEWCNKYQSATKADSWGQVVEAQDEYQRLAADIASRQGLPFIASSDKVIMQRLSLCLSARVHALKNIGDSITPTDMKALEPVFAALFTGQEVDTFPVDPHKYQSVQPVRPAGSGEILCDSGERSHWEQHQEVLRSVVGTVVCIRIEKIGLKDALEYIDPFITVLVADPKTNLLDTRDTPVALDKNATHITFNHQVYLNVSLEDMHRQEAALFFEFKHYKPKKKKISTRCWALMELAELKADQEMVLELYHKPTDLRKKKITLHTEKPLYLHMYVSFLRN